MKISFLPQKCVQTSEVKESCPAHQNRLPEQGIPFSNMVEGAELLHLPKDLYAITLYEVQNIYVDNGIIVKIEISEMDLLAIQPQTPNSLKEIRIETFF